MPHSEIAGSKPILGLPALIAEYHVLHRLLLPRHPPNALLALDLIQKKQGSFCGVVELPLWPVLLHPAPFCKKGQALIKSILSRSPSWFVKGSIVPIFSDENSAGLVYLTWIVTCLAGRTRKSRRIAAISMKLMCISLNDVNLSNWTAKQ